MLIPTRTKLLAVCALLASTLEHFFSVVIIIDAAPSAIIATCINNGCSKVFSILDPCGGGATNETLQQSLIFTPTQSLGGCQCNHVFYNEFSSCLSCIASQGESSPEIQNQQDWETSCVSYGFDVTLDPVVNSTNGINNGGSGNNNGDGSSGGGLSTGAIVGIVVGVLVAAGLVGAFLFARRRNKKQEKSAVFEPTGGSPNGSGHYNHAAATADTADRINNNDHAYPQEQQQDYPSPYQHNDYYNDQHDHYQNNNSYAAQHAQDNYYSSDYTNGNVNGNVNGYYDTTNNIRPHETMIMQNLNTNPGNGGYVPPPPHPASPTREAYAASPRSSDTFPQSLRNKPKAWGTPATSYVTQPQELTSGLIATEQQHPFGNHQHQQPSSQFNDKTEFGDGEELEPPAPYSNEYSPRRSMTPPRATMQSYRDEFSRPSFEREPRRSGSDRGSISGVAGGGMNNMVIRGSDNGSSGYGFNSNSNTHVDYDQQGEQLDFARASQDSPEGARRRARAAELFSAEGTRQ
ncbi:hypothetical protein BG015_010286 [Linnemannia schmuckeri]|uniref:Uncharacterized protein n=1 Tax=Linnemannia schmuckeri TaxID=64567 RepID=A0A9P5RUC3_9FUNG|nr:hypothetical protein BG015_010286 [Linnemannia schmuckeri]